MYLSECFFVATSICLVLVHENAREHSVRIAVKRRETCSYLDLHKAFIYLANKLTLLAV